MRIVIAVLLSCLAELIRSSPVYNMQPAYITANIGSTGRNIRNLPCISRKTNQNGVCMFAIDCLKSNGTHLGTCIDRFYFGSCCHVGPVPEILENSIDASIIPAREPPHRITSSTSSTTTTSTSTTLGSSTTQEETVVKITPKPLIVSTTSVKPEVTTSFNLDTTTIDDRLIEEGDEEQLDVTTENIRLSTFQSVDGNEVPTTLRLPADSTSSPATTSTSTTTTAPPPTTTRPITTLRPKPIRTTTTRPSPLTKPIIHSSVIPPKSPPSTSTAKPTQTPAKPNKPYITTIKPIRTTSKVPVKPSTRPESINVVTTQKVVSTISTTTAKPLSTQTSKVADTTTTERPTTIAKDPMHMTDTNQISTLGNEDKGNVSFTGLDGVVVNGNPATNEIESDVPLVASTSKKPIPTPSSASTSTTTTTTTEASTKPSGFVTWSSNDGVSSTESSNHSQVPDDWQPLTTPDSWVLLPSISTVTENPDSSSVSSVSSDNNVTSAAVPAESSSPSSATPSSSPSSTVPDTTSEVETTERLVDTTTEDDNSVAVTTPTASGTTIDSLSSESDDDSLRNGTTTPSSGGPTNLTSSSSSSSSTQSSSTIVDDDDLPIKPVNMSDFTDVCGRRMYPEARIVGGEKSAFGRWPWQISLRQWRTSTYLHKCGAALLNENWAITAAHCVDNVPPSDLLLRLGEHDLSTESEPYLHQERRVQIVASHPQFDPRTFEYDLALLRFYEPVTFQPNIIPVCVPQTDETFVGRTAHVTGWGRLYEDGPLPSVLQEVSVPVINNTVCESMYRAAGYIEHIPHIFICAGWRRGGFDSCEGDSGGPMVIQRTPTDSRFLLAGVISWGIGCAEPNQPGVYTRISEFRDWINQILQF